MRLLDWMHQILMSKQVILQELQSSKKLICFVAIRTSWELVVSGIFRLHFVTIGGNGDTSSIFIHLNGLYPYKWLCESNANMLTMTTQCAHILKLLTMFTTILTSTVVTDWECIEFCSYCKSNGYWDISLWTKHAKVIVALDNKENHRYLVQTELQLSIHC